MLYLGDVLVVQNMHHKRSVSTYGTGSWAEKKITTISGHNITAHVAEKFGFSQNDRRWPAKPKQYLPKQTNGMHTPL